MKGLRNMRHYAIMRAVFCLPFFLAVCAPADEAVDRAVISRIINRLNQLPISAALFTQDADGSSELVRLRKGKRLEYRILNPPGAPGALHQADRPTVTISHEPWGEATINWPGMESMMKSNRPVELLNPSIQSQAIRFVTPDVALADGSWIYKDEGASIQNIPLLFVMKNEGGNWKIASLRVLASH
jgi:hypothetical protein